MVTLFVGVAIDVSVVPDNDRGVGCAQVDSDTGSGWEWGGSTAECDSGCAQYGSESGG